LENELAGKWNDQYRDISKQLAYLFSGRTISVLEIAWLKRYERFLAGMQRRIERINNNPQKDEKKGASLGELLSTWEELWNHPSVDAAAHFDIYLNIEELRLKLYVPELAKHHKIRKNELMTQLQTLIST
ncbi:MAG: DUF3418 domain-containing protein, partial [Pseudomonadota bacterium]